MSRRVRRAAVAVHFLGLVLMAGPAAARQAALPPADQVLARYHEAIGGREAILAHESVVTTGHLSIPAAGLAGSIQIYAARPDRRLVIVDFGDGLVLRTGFDGETGWAAGTPDGPTLLQEAYLAQMRDESDLLGSFRIGDRIASLETVERAEIEGQTCLKVRVVWTSGRESFDCYAEESGLLIASITPQETPIGPITVTTHFAEYREFDDVRVPTRATLHTAELEQVIVIESVRYDDVDPAVFELPDEIRTLLYPPQPSSD